MTLEYRNVIELIFPNSIELLPGVSEVSELNMARTEFEVLKSNPEELLKRTAYFAKYEGQESDIYKLGLSGSLNISSGTTKRQQFFNRNLFKTGYASHGLFPYRGKFHPQLIRGLLNILQIPRKGLVLDPMGGSGTLAIEANILGINAVSNDISPFCEFMMRTKAQALHMRKSEIDKYTEMSSEAASKLLPNMQKEEVLDELRNYTTTPIILNLQLLSFLDTIGYAERRKTGTFSELFKSVSNRYSGTLAKWIDFRDKSQNNIGQSIINLASATSYKRSSKQFNAILTSPPYSFAIDYVKNDANHLRFFGANIDQLYGDMIGLRGKGTRKRLEYYFHDMNKVIENNVCHLKSGGYFVIIVGDNTRQTKGVRISDVIRESANKHGLIESRIIEREIHGMRNTMKTEKIMVFQSE